MSKTYIVETDDETQLIVEIGVNSTGAALICTHPVRFLTPYTEPDVEQIREEAFKNGYDAACKDIDVKSKTNAAYQKGLEDAWEAAKKIVLSTEDGGLFDYDVRKAVFGCGNYMALKKYSASEAIEKIRQYEQEQEEIKVGDEVVFHHDDERPDTVIVVTYIGQDEFIDGMDGRGMQYAHNNPKKWTKTGRHFPEIAEMLKKMRKAEE